MVLAELTNAARHAEHVTIEKMIVLDNRTAFVFRCDIETHFLGDQMVYGNREDCEHAAVNHCFNEPVD